MLKKEFKEEDVLRLRNLVTGDYSSKTIKSIGYQKPSTQHKEGDIWEENGKSWTIIDGIKQNINKLDSAKDINRIPVFCPSCNHVMKRPYDKDYFRIHKMCFNCVIDFETELKRLGLFQEYEKNIINSDIDGFILDFKNFVLEQISQDDKQHFSEAGELEKWEGSLDKSKILTSLDKTITYLESLKK